MRYDATPRRDDAFDARHACHVIMRAYSAHTLQRCRYALPLLIFLYAAQRVIDYGASGARYVIVDEQRDARGIDISLSSAERSERARYAVRRRARSERVDKEAR